MVSIIIVNWNGAHLIRSCLDSVCRQTYTEYEVIFVDNGSTDDSVNLVERSYPTVTIVGLGSNHGFAGGNIAGLQHSRGEFVVLLNTDAALADDWLEVVLSALNSDVAIGSCFTKLVIEGTSLIDSAGDNFTTAFNAVKIGDHQLESAYSSRKFVTGACAAAVMYRRSMLEQIGFFDEDFFLNAEDTDLNMRAWLAGWKCLFVPDSVAYHKVSATLGVLSDTAVYHYARNIEWVWIKNVPLITMLRYTPQRIMYESVSFIYYCIVAGKWKAYCKGKFDACRKLPAMIKKRKQVQKLVRLNSRDIAADLLSFGNYLRSGMAHLRYFRTTNTE
jgi:GT2 family glycosyltransferase